MIGESCIAFALLRGKLYILRSKFSPSFTERGSAWGKKECEEAPSGFFQMRQTHLVKLGASPAGKNRRRRPSAADRRRSKQHSVMYRVQSAPWFPREYDCKESFPFFEGSRSREDFFFPLATPPFFSFVAAIFVIPRASQRATIS